MVVRGRDEVGADQPVGGRAADRERAGEQPEGRHPGRLAEHPQRRPDRVGRTTGGAIGRPRSPRTGGGRGRPGVRAATQSTSGTTSNAPTATASDDAGASRGRATSAASSGRNTSWPVAAAGGEHTDDQTRGGATNQRVGDRRREARCVIGAGAEADDHAPAAAPAARPRSSTRSAADPAATNSSADQHHPADSEAVDQRRGERPARPKNRMRLTETAAEMTVRLQAELVLQRDDEHARRGPEPGCAEQREERDRGDDPGRVRARAGGA